MGVLRIHQGSVVGLSITVSTRHTPRNGENLRKVKSSIACLKTAFKFGNKEEGVEEADLSTTDAREFGKTR